MKWMFPDHFPMALAYGAVCQIGQIVLLRELLMVFHGNEFSLGIILAAWMVWVGAGSLIVGPVVERSADPRRPLRICAYTAAVMLPATVLFIRVLRAMFRLPSGVMLSPSDTLLACLLVMAPVGLLLGAQFVLLARVWRDFDARGDTSGAGKTYVTEALGHAAGGLLFTFVLVRGLNSLQTMAAVATTMVAGLLWLDRSRPGRVRRWTPAVLLAGILLVASLEASHRRAAELQWRLLAPDYEMIETRDSRYGAVAVLRRGDQVSFFQSGHLLFSSGGTTEAATGFEEQEGIAFAHLAMTQHSDPRRILLIGGGLRGTLREILRYPVDQVEYVEVDEVLVAVALPYLTEGTINALRDPRVRLLHGDGRLLVRSGDSSYDLIIVDVPDPATAVLNRYYTRQFFREARARMQPGGILVINATSTADVRGLAVANRNATIYHTLNSVFAEVLPIGARALVYTAATQPGRLTADAATLAHRFRESGVQTVSFTGGHFAILLDQEPLRRMNWILRHHGRSADAHLVPPDTGPLFVPDLAELAQREDELAPVHERFFINSDFRPVGYYHTLVFWSVLTRGNQTAALRWIARVQPWWVLPPVAVLLIAALLLRRGARWNRKAVGARFAVLCAVFTTGLSTMALQVALLFVFQSVYGFVYEMVGLIVAIFMTGLGLGAAVTQHGVRDRSDLRLLAAVQGGIALLGVVLALSLPMTARLQSPGTAFVLFSTITFAAGLLNGIDFPLTTACYAALDRGPDRSSGTVYGVELFGACSGAAVAGAVVVPVLGIVACSLLAAIANATATVVLLICGRTYGHVE